MLLHEYVIKIICHFKLCLDIYQCRITRHTQMELDLGQKLISIFSSPSEFEKWTQGEFGVDARVVNFRFEA